MATSTRDRYWAQIDFNGRLIPGSTKISPTKPKGGFWKDITDSILTCCTTTTTSSTTSTTTTTA